MCRYVATFPFHTRGRDGEVTVRVRPNEDPLATGHDLVAENYNFEAFKGFPVLTAEITFPREGPAGWFGWIQLVRHVRRGEVIDEAIDAFGPLAPLYVEGYLPTFADAPANPDHRDLDWCADAYLVEVAANTLTPVVGFAWGYRRSHDDRTELIQPVRPQSEAWLRIRQRLATDYPDWSCASGHG